MRKNTRIAKENVNDFDKWTGVGDTTQGCVKCVKGVYRNWVLRDGNSYCFTLLNTNQNCVVLN